MKYQAQKNDALSLSALAGIAPKMKDRGFWKLPASGFCRGCDKIRNKPSRYGGGFVQIIGGVAPNTSGKLPSGTEYGAKRNKYGVVVWGRVA